MTWDTLVSHTHFATQPGVQLGLLAAVNLLAAVGGGRVTSPAKGVAGLTLLGSAVGLGLVVVVRRLPLDRALAGLSLAAVASSCRARSHFSD
jgi:hypothetical protein